MFVCVSSFQSVMLTNDFLVCFSSNAPTLCRLLPIIPCSPSLSVYNTRRFASLIIIRAPARSGCRSVNEEDPFETCRFNPFSTAGTSLIKLLTQQRHQTPPTTSSPWIRLLVTIDSAEPRIREQAHQSNSYWFDPPTCSEVNSVLTYKKQVAHVVIMDQRNSYCLVITWLRAASEAQKTLRAAARW